MAQHMAEYLTADTLGGANTAAMRHGFFTRRGGVSRGIYASLNTGLGSRDDPAHVRENRQRAMQALGAMHLATPHQRHTNICATITNADDWPFDSPPVADAIATTVPGLMVAVNTADCGPILFADADAGVIAAAHAGWRGAIGGVLENTIAAMQGLGARREHISAAIGPCITQTAYEVGPEFPAPFLEQDPANRRFFTPAPRQGHWMFNLPGYIAERLRRAGLQHIEQLGRCTHGEEELFFSWRRTCQRGEEDYGRQLSGIVLTT